MVVRARTGSSAHPWIRRNEAFGNQTSTPEGTSNVGGMTPTTVKACPFNRIVLPITCGSPPNRCCQRR
jgi:hypothetical protein